MRAELAQSSGRSTQVRVGDDKPGHVRERNSVALRVACHLGVWLSLGVPTLIEVASGLHAYGDDAAISSRAYGMLSHPTLVGMLTSARTPVGHPLFDPGPLMFPLLGLPLRIDPFHGWLWGPLVVCGIALSIGVEAALRVRRWAAVLIPVVLLELLWLYPPVLVDPEWNSHFAILLFIASLGVAWLVCNGQPGWWAVLVFFASVEAQAHLFYVAPAALLSLTALVVGLITAHRYWWVAVGAVVGVLCWLAPIIQQIEGPYGNLSSLLSASHDTRTQGLSFALQSLGSAGSPHPIWLTSLAFTHSLLPSLARSMSPAWGVGVLIVLLVVAVGALCAHWRALGTLSLITLACSIAFVAEVTDVPVASALSLGYLMDVFWVIGILLWLCVVWMAAKLAKMLLPKLVSRKRTAIRATAGLVGACAVGALCFPALSSAANPRIGWPDGSTQATTVAAKAIERQTPRGPVALTMVSPFPGRHTAGQIWLHGLFVIEIERSIGYRLQTDGWYPGSTSMYEPRGPNTSLAIAGPSWPSFVVYFRGTRVTAVRRLPEG
ncbi:MAG: hypothetical protein ACRDVP_12440 [Acidimicrobiales bacterium]